MGAKKLNYSVCIDAVFRESKLSFVEAMSVIHRLGYKAYEFWLSLIHISEPTRH